MNRKLYRYITYLFFISLVFTGISFSRFSTTLTNQNTGTPEGTTVSNPIIFYVPGEALSENGSKVLSLNNLHPYSPVQSYYFDIVNYKDNKTSDMGFSYTISLETLGALPLELKIYDMDNETYVNLSRNVTAEISMPKDNRTTHSYRLDISWKNDNTNAIKDCRFSQEIDYVNIVVEASQAQ